VNMNKFLNPLNNMKAGRAKAKAYADGGEVNMWGVTPEETFVGKLMAQRGKPLEEQLARPTTMDDPAMGFAGTTVGKIGKGVAGKILPKANLETDVFHGTTQPDIKVFKPKIRPREQLGFGTHVTVDPEFASEYAIGEVARRGPSPNVMPLKAKLGNVLDATKIIEEGTPEFVLAQKLAGKKLFTQKNVDGVRTAYLQNAIDSTSPKRAQQIIRDAGFDSVKYNAEIKSISGPHGYTKGRSAESYVILDPEKNLRPKFVKQDLNTKSSGGAVHQRALGAKLFGR
jgi:hypothetical protein